MGGWGIFSSRRYKQASSFSVPPSRWSWWNLLYSGKDAWKKAGLDHPLWFYCGGMSGFCRPISLQSVLTKQGIMGLAKKRDVIPQRATKEGSPVVSYSLDASWRLITPGWVTWTRVYDVLTEPKHLLTPGYITDDASQRFYRSILEKEVTV